MHDYRVHNHKISKSCPVLRCIPFQRILLGRARMSIHDMAITSTHILYLSWSNLIQQNTRCDVTLTGFGVLWWHQKDPLGAVSAGYG